jgi:hypothetical protein
MDHDILLYMFVRPPSLFFSGLQNRVRQSTGLAVIAAAFQLFRPDAERPHRFDDGLLRFRLLRTRIRLLETIHVLSLLPNQVAESISSRLRAIGSVKVVTPGF